MATNVASKIAAPTERRQVPRINPQSALLDCNGMQVRSWFVRLPEGMIADDLKEPGIWEKAQARLALRRHDRVYLVAFDDSWAAEAVIAGADSKSATLTGLRVFGMAERSKPLFSDQKYRVVWSGAGYQVERRADGHRMTQPIGSEELAIRDLKALYPQRV